MPFQEYRALGTGCLILSVSSLAVTLWVVLMVSAQVRVVLDAILELGKVYISHPTGYLYSQKMQN